MSGRLRVEEFLAPVRHAHMPVEVGLASPHFGRVLHPLLHVPHPGTGMSMALYRPGRAFYPFLGVGAHVKKRHAL